VILGAGVRRMEHVALERLARGGAGLKYLRLELLA
jgi:hypothetical protein